MFDSIETSLGWVVFGVAIFAAAWSSAMTARFSRGGAMMESMMQQSFLPEKRRAYLLVLSVEGSTLLLSGLVWGLTAGGVVPSWLGLWLVAPLLSLGMLCVGTVTWLGLRPSRLTVAEQATLRNRALTSLFLAPLAAE